MAECKKCGAKMKVANFIQKNMPGELREQPSYSKMLIDLAVQVRLFLKRTLCNTKYIYS